MSLRGAPKNRLEGKTILITGANSGIGKATALGLARLGANLVLVCRNEVRAQEAIREIKDITNNNSIGLIVADLMLQREVRKVSMEFLANYSRLDVLINNAGSNFPKYAETDDGIERTMALNYFTPFLLSNLLLGLLKKSAPTRIVNVTSVGHFGGHLDLSNVGRDKKMGPQGFSAYQRSKLALVLFTYELARRVDPKQVTVNCLHPGAVRTHIWAHAGFVSPLTMIASLFMRSADSGARTPIYLASSSEVHGITGRYFDDCKPKMSSKQSYDESLASKLWDLTVELSGMQPSN